MHIMLTCRLKKRVEGLEKERLELKRDLSTVNSELSHQREETKALNEKLASAEKSHREVRH
jgi:septal ring factor EnvC (AmiA/AmiB activator)